MVHPQGVQPVPTMQAPSGPVVPTPEQLGKIRSELDIVHGNITVMSEMLTEMTPGQEEAGDLQLLQVKFGKKCVCVVVVKKFNAILPITDFPLLESGPPFPNIYTTLKKVTGILTEVES